MLAIFNRDNISAFQGKSGFCGKAKSMNRSQRLDTCLKLVLGETLWNNRPQKFLVLSSIKQYQSDSPTACGNLSAYCARLSLRAVSPPITYHVVVAAKSLTFCILLTYCAFSLFFGKLGEPARSCGDGQEDDTEESGAPRFGRARPPGGGRWQPNAPKAATRGGESGVPPAGRGGTKGERKRSVNNNAN